MPTNWPALRTADDRVPTFFDNMQANGLVVDARADGWKTALAQARSVRWSPADSKLVFQHRRVRDGDIYFLVNYGESFRGEVSFPHLGDRAEIWDPDTGQTAPVGRYTEHHGRIHIPVTLDHFASAFFVFSRNPVAVHVTETRGGDFHFGADGRLRGQFDQPGDYAIKLSDRTARSLTVTLPAPLAVTGPWQLSVSAGQAVSPHAPLTLRLERLVSWRELPELKHYAGSATYATDFNVPPEFLGGDFALFLDLGEVFDLARVTINDRDAGTVWAPPFRLEVTGLVKQGRNTLRLEVPNVLKNHLEKGDDYRRPSGLLGPVKIVPVRQATLAGSPEPKASAAPADFQQIEVFRSGEGGYHTYRIPALIETRKGTLLAFCEGRKNSDSDRGDIDLLLRRSPDGGKTWLPAQQVWNDGTNTCGNPCPVVDRETGVIWLLLSWNSGQLRRAEDVQAGFGEDSRRVFVTHSSDDGATWAEPLEITTSVKRPEWSGYATGPGNGIQLRSGRLVIPCNHKVKVEETLSCHTHILYSDDHGRTWKLGGEADEKTNEPAVVELGDGSLLLNMRNNYGRNRQAISRSRDAGLTWSPVGFDDALIEPVCQGSLVTARRWSEASDELLFSNPADIWRARMTVRLSRDGGRTWPASQLIHEGPAAYSSLCFLGQDEAGLLYERGRQRQYEGITYARFSLRWLAAGDERTTIEGDDHE
jgi:sialidase-1